MDLNSLLGWLQHEEWAAPAAAALILALGWIVGGLLGRGVDAALRRVPLIRLIMRHIEDRDEVLLRMRIRQAVRWATFAAAIWAGWRVLMAGPGTSWFLSELQMRAGTVVAEPAPRFLVNAAVVVLATWLLVRVLRWLRTGYDGLRRRIEAERGRKLHGVSIQRLQLLSTDQEISLLRAFARYVRYALDLVLIVVYLTAVFSLFPHTRALVLGIAASLLGVLRLGWKNFVSYLPSLTNLFFIVVATVYGLRVVRFMFNEVGKGTITLPGFHPEWAIPTFQLVRFAVIGLALVIAFPYLPGSSSPAFQGVSIFIGALPSLGSTSVVANIVSGVVLTYTRAFRVGDRVKIADTVGDVTEKALLVTRVRTIKNVEVTIPNGLVLQSHIINYSAMAAAQGLILNTTITLGYNVPWRKVHEALISAARRTNGILDVPAPFVFQTSLDDSYVSYELNAFTAKANDMHIIYSDLHQSVQDACNEAGIEILSPKYGAIRDGNRSTIPSGHLPKEYQAPSFRVRMDGGDH